MDESLKITLIPKPKGAWGLRVKTKIREVQEPTVLHLGNEEILHHPKPGGQSRR